MTQYGVIAADPPWRFHGTPKLAMRSVHNHYQTMTLDDIKALPVGDLAAKNCALFLWVLDTHLNEGLQVIDAWGFRYCTIGFTWAKTTVTGKWAMNCGWWTRANPEHCLLATRGAPRPMAHDVRRLVVSQQREHSRKPDEVYERFIPRLCSGPFVELFARTRRDGWDTAFSDQPDKF